MTDELDALLNELTSAQPSPMSKRYFAVRRRLGKGVGLVDDRLAKALPNGCFELLFLEDGRHPQSNEPVTKDKSPAPDEHTKHPRE